MLSGRMAKSLVLVFTAESSFFSFFSRQSSKNFEGKIAAITFFPILIGIALNPFLNSSLASPIVRSS